MCLLRKTRGGELGKPCAPAGTTQGAPSCQTPVTGSSNLGVVFGVA